MLPSRPGYISLAKKAKIYYRSYTQNSLFNKKRTIYYNLAYYLAYDASLAQLFDLT